MKSDRIPSKPWAEVPGLHYVVLDELPEDQRQPFGFWLYGQTMPVILEEDIKYRKPVSCAYYEDYSRWYEAWSKGKIAEILD